MIKVNPDNVVDKPARLIIRLLFGFVSDLSSSTKMKTNTERAMLSLAAHKKLLSRNKHSSEFCILLIVRLTCLPDLGAGWTSCNGANSCQPTCDFFYGSAAAAAH